MYTPPKPGLDGNLCTGDSGETSPSVTLVLGDITAFGGPPTGAASIIYPTVDGHETVLKPISFGILPLLATPFGSTIVAKTLISSTEDLSLADYTGIPNMSPSAVETDRTTFAQFLVNGVATFSGSKTATTSVPGSVAPGEAFSYSLAWGNGDAKATGPGTFVDVLPFDGDARGTSGLGAQGLQVLSLSAGMVNPETMGTVGIEYTTDPAADVSAAVNTVGNEDGATGVSWTAYTSGAVDNVTAVRFTTSNDLVQYSQGSATVSVVAPTLARAAVVYNDMYGRTAAYQEDPLSVQVIRAASLVELTSSAARLTGKVSRDLDFTSSATGADVPWPAGAELVELISSRDDVVGTAAITADGSYSFPSIAPDTYTVRIKAAESSGWAVVGDSRAIVVADADAIRDVLYQEVVADPVLVADTAKTHLGSAVTVDVTANDTLAFPTAPGSVFTQDGVALGGQAPTYGSVALVASTRAAGQSRIVYTPPALWPAALTGQTKFDDVFTYTWTNAAGVNASTTVTVTVYAPVVATADTTTIGDTVSTIDALANDSGDQIALTGTPSVVSGDVTVVRPPVITDVVVAKIPAEGSTGFTPTVLNPGTIPSGVPVITAPPAGGTVTVNPDGTITFSGTGAAAGVYTFTATWTDEYGQSASITYTITVQGAPTAVGGTATIGVGKSAAWENPPVTTGTIASASVSVAPSAGTAIVTTAGEVTFDAGASSPGTYTFTVSYVDDLGQIGTADYTVIVQEGTLVSGETSMTIGQDRTANFGTTVTSLGSIVTAQVTAAPSGGTVTANVDGTVIFNGAGVAPGTYSFTVTFTDDVGQVAVVVYTVSVQAKPKLDGAAATIQVGGSHVFPINPVSSGPVTEAISKAPSAGSAVLTAERTLVFEAGTAAPGRYIVEVTATDDLDQSVTAVFEVIVEGPVIVDPPVDPEPPLVTEPPPSVVPPTEPPGSGDGNGTLPWTGANSVGVLLAGVAVLVAGGVVYVGAMRHRGRRG